MASTWHQKKEKAAIKQFESDLASRPDDTTKNQATAAAMGGGDKNLFDKKLSKEEKKAKAKAVRDAKKKARNKGDGDDDDDDDEDTAAKATQVLQAARDAVEGSKTHLGGEDSGIDHERADALAAEGTICTFSASRKGVDSRSRDISVQNFTLQHMGAVLLDESQMVLNHGNRYGLIGRNGCGKSTLLRALGARAVPIPRGIDIFYLSEEIEPSDTMSALDAVMSVDEERNRLEVQAEDLNHVLGELADKASTGDLEETEDGRSAEEQQEEIVETLNSVYERLDALDAATAEVRARTILKGLGFTHQMQSKKTREFSGGWRMRVSLARALFIQPVCLLLDEPTNHLDMEAVIWLEDYLSRWDRILFLISHSQDVRTTVCCGRRKHCHAESHNRIPLSLSPKSAVLEQCVQSHDPLYQSQKARVLRWKLRPVYQNKERKGGKPEKAVQVGAGTDQGH
jgi:ATP-binding cassette subfamily F protein 2